MYGEAHRLIKPTSRLDEAGLLKKYIGVNVLNCIRPYKFQAIDNEHYKYATVIRAPLYWGSWT